MTEGIDPNTLEQISGGTSLMNAFLKCPDCGSTDCSSDILSPTGSLTIIVCRCNACGKTWDQRFDNSGGSGAML